VVDHQETSQQAVPGATEKSLNSKGKPVRGIDWAAIFRRHPELEAPGYVDALKAAKLRRSAES
jgi:hypothetical protein